MENISLELDKTGFPIIQTPSRTWLHLLPVTKVQFELYLWQAQPLEFNAARYARATAPPDGNPRVAVTEITRVNEFGIYMTGITRREAEAFAAWMSENARPCRIPTVEQWRKNYAWLQDTDFKQDLWPKILALPNLASRAHTLLRNLHNFCDRLHGPGLDAMAVRRGVLEYVGGGLMGIPHADSGRATFVVEKPVVDRGDHAQKSDGLRMLFL